MTAPTVTWGQRRARGRGATPVAPLRIALLAPYSGANLGDAAIQEAAIQNIRRRYPDAYIAGITADPVFTTSRHGIPCFPLAARTLERGLHQRGEAGARQKAGPTEPRSLAARARAFVKGVPVVGALLRAAARAARSATGSAREVRHLTRGIRFARRLDAIIAAGSGQLDDGWGGAWGHPYALFKWAVLSRMVGAQFVVLSVGTGSLRSALSRWFVRRALQLASYRSYRDEGSKELLRDFSFTHEDGCWPDLAFSLLRDGPDTVRRVTDALRCVGVSPIAYGRPWYWSTDDPNVHERYLRELTEFVAWLVEHDRQVVVFTTGSVDRLVVQDLLARLAAGPQGERAKTRLRVARDNTLDELLAELAGVDAVVASRLHGVILAHLLGKPTLAVSFDRKVDAHMMDVRMERYCLDLAAVDHAKLADAFERLERNAADVKAALHESCCARRDALDQQYDAVLQSLVRDRSTTSPS